jgi:hypothetical protein
MGHMDWISGEPLWTLKWTFRFPTLLTISLLPGQLAASQDGLIFAELTDCLLWSEGVALYLKVSSSNVTELGNFPAWHATVLCYFEYFPFLREALCMEETSILIASKPRIRYDSFTKHSLTNSASRVYRSWLYVADLMAGISEHT